MKSLVTLAHCVSLVLLAGLTETASGEQVVQELVRVGAEPTHAALTAVNQRSFTFSSQTGGDITLPTNQLVRWGHPAPSLRGDEIHLVDGSVIGLAASWAGHPAVLFNEDLFDVDAEFFGRLHIPRSMVRSLHCSLPRDPVRRLQKIDSIAALVGGADSLVLNNGERLIGRLVGLAQAEHADDGDAWPVVEFTGELGRMTLSLSRIESGVLASMHARASDTDARLWIGLRNAALLRVQAVRLAGDRVTLTTLSGLELTVDSANAIAYLQGDGARITYLSDLEPIEYFHQPFLEIPWPLHRDRNVLGGPLIVGENRYLRGLGLHSASRLTFTVPPQAVQFVAGAAMDDSAQPEGSVTFGVYVQKQGNWAEAIGSLAVEAGEPPRQISIAVSEADQISLVVDYGDHGDQRDYANWLDARFELSAGQTGPHAPASQP